MKVGGCRERCGGEELKEAEKGKEGVRKQR